MNGALIAHGSSIKTREVARLAQWFLQEHFARSSREPRPFISLFGSDEHARKWTASRMKNKPGIICDIYIIDPRKLGGKAILDASVLAERLQINLPQSARSQINVEFLVLHRIPP